MSRISETSELWLRKVGATVVEGGRSPRTVDTYCRQLKAHVFPAMGQVRLGEATTPLVDRVIGSIKARVSASTAKRVAA
jgi:hypothetical protein